MKLLMITRKVDAADGLSGFVYNWVKKISEQVDKLYVITWQKSDRGNLPANVELVSLPENKFFKIFSLKWQALKILPKVDGVFCHMNPEYTIIVGPLARLLRKKVVSWYAHGAVSFRLKLLAKIANQILTSSAKGFRLPSKKVTIIGQGIDLEMFYSKPKDKLNQPLKLLTVGRISPTKDYESMIKAVSILAKDQSLAVELRLIGDVGLKNQAVYLDSLKDMVAKMNLGQQVLFLGPKPNSEIPRYLQESDIFINLSQTGSLDKAVLEAMASGCLVLTSNEAYAEILPPELLVKNNQPKLLAERIVQLAKLSNDQLQNLRNSLRAEVVKNHNLDNFIKNICSKFNH